MLKNYKWKRIIIKIYFFSIYIYLFFLERKGNLNNNEKLISILENINIKHFKKSILKYPKLKEIKLNYSGKCGKIFKYKKNNKRDLIMFAYKSTQNDFNSRRGLLIYAVIDSIKKNIPNAKIICFVPENSNISLIIHILKKNNVLIIKEKKFLKMKLVSSRFLYEYKYLKRNIINYDRVIHADLTDIIFFSDIFKTLKPNELIINKECGENSKFGKKGNFILYHPNDIKWFNRSFGENKAIVDIFKRINPMVINGGLIMGDSKQYLQFLDIMKRNFNHKKALYYGYDQMLINVLYYTGKFNKINIKFDLCTQRSCFIPKLKWENNKLYFKNGCSPVLIHKSYPTIQRVKKNYLN